MQWKKPKNTEKYYWTQHVQEKMHYYGLSEQKVLGVIRKPVRIETGIVENTVAVMIPVGNIKKGIIKSRWGQPSYAPADAKAMAGKEASEGQAWSQEIWVMYQIKEQQSKSNEQKKLEAQIKNIKSKEKSDKLMKLMPKKLVIISAWRYPGVSPEKNPIPEEILREIEEISFV